MTVGSNQLRHISLHLEEQESRLRESLYGALNRAVTECVGSQHGAKVLDVGVGRGELLQRLKAKNYETYGIDLESECVRVAGEFGSCRQGGIEEIKVLFSDSSFDVIVCSHVLEHMDSPHFALTEFAAIGAGGYVFAIPNPLRPLRIVRAIFGSKRADHPEHVYAWGCPEFAAMLLRCGFDIDAWYADRVTINPFHGRIGSVLTRLLAPLESGVLPRIFPMLSSSIIVRCHVKAKAE